MCSRLLPLHHSSALHSGREGDADLQREPAGVEWEEDLSWLVSLEPEAQTGAAPRPTSEGRGADDVHASHLAAMWLHHARMKAASIHRGSMAW